MGRPKQFDRDDVLERALDLFLEVGYHDASVRRLSTAMGINVATLFSEFGDKEWLYGHAMAKYESQKLPFLSGLLRGQALTSTSYFWCCATSAATTLGLFVMIRARILAAIVHETVEGAIATLLSSLPRRSPSAAAP